MMLSKPTSIIVVAVCIATTGIAGASEVPYQRLPSQIMEQWEYAVTPGEHWTQPHDMEQSGIWKPVRVGTPAPYPDEIEPSDQYRWPFVWADKDVEPGKAVYFRRGFRLDGQVQAATLRFCSYGEEAAVYLNGERLVELDQPGSLTVLDITDRVQTGANYLAVAVIAGPRNYGLLVMGQAELTWPPTHLKWVSTDKLEPSQTASRREQWAGLEPIQAAEWTVSAPWLSVGSSLESMYVPLAGWKFTEPGLSLEWKGTSYPTVHPQGGMPEYSTAYFRTWFAPGGAVTSTVLQILGDDSYEVYLNGYPIAVEKRMDRAYIPLRVDVTEYMREGNMLNIVAARVTNDWGPGRIHIQPTLTICF